MGRGTLPGLVRVLGIVASNLLRWLFLHPWIASSHAYADPYSASATSVKGALWSSFSMQVSTLLVFCLMTLAIWSPQSQLRLSTQWDHYTLSFPSPCIMTWKLSKAVNWSNHRAHLLCFLALRDQSLSFTVWCSVLKNPCFIHVIYFLVVSCGKVNLDCYSLLARSRSLFII